MTIPPEDPFEYVSEYTRVAAKSFKIDPKTQRPEDPTWVARLIKEFDPNKVGVVTASVREGGKFLLDGQHRVLAAKGAGRGSQKIECRLITGVRTTNGVRPLTLEEEAAFFVALNDSKHVDPAAKFNARATTRDPVALDILGILHVYGWMEVGKWRKAKVFTVISVAERLYRSGKNSLNSRPEDGRDALKDVLQTISAAWGVGPGTALGPVVSGMGLAFLRNYEDQRAKERDGFKPAVMDPLRLAGVLSTEAADPQVLLARGRALAGIRHTRIQVALAELITTADASGCKGRTPRPEWHN